MSRLASPFHPCACTSLYALQGPAVATSRSSHSRPWRPERGASVFAGGTSRTLRWNEGKAAELARSFAASKQNNIFEEPMKEPCSPPPPPCNYIPPHWTWNVLRTFIGFKIHSNGFWQRPGFHILGNLLEVEMESSCSLQRIAHHWVQPLTGASLPAFTFTSSCCVMTTLTTHLVYRWKQRSKMNVWKQATMGPL